MLFTQNSNFATIVEAIIDYKSREGIVIKGGSMKRFQAALVIFTLLTGVLGLGCSINAGDKKAAQNTGKEMTAYEMPEANVSVTEGVTEEKESFIESDVPAVVISEGEFETLISDTAGITNDEIVIPEVEVADFDNEEDGKRQPVVSDDKKSDTAPVVDFVAGSTLPEPDHKEAVYTKAGIDVSQWQGVIDWGKVKAAGIDFVMLRVGFRGNTVGKIYEDTYFERNVKGALENGVEVGIYFYSMARNEAEALEEAAWVCERIKGYNITYPVAFDLEEFDRNRLEGVSNAQLNKNAEAFLKYVEGKGYTPSLYSSKCELYDRWDVGRFGYSEVWLAHWVKETDYTGRYSMWQYTDKGRVDGIGEYVDMNVAYFYDDKNDAEEPGDENEKIPEDSETETPSPEATPSPSPTPEEEITPSPEITPDGSEGTEVDEWIQPDKESVIYPDKAENAETAVTVPAGEQLHVIFRYNDGWVKVIYGDITGFLKWEPEETPTE